MKLQRKWIFLLAPVAIIVAFYVLRALSLT